MEEHKSIQRPLPVQTGANKYLTPVYMPVFVVQNTPAYV